VKKLMRYVQRPAFGKQSKGGNFILGVAFFLAGTVKEIRGKGIEEEERK